MSRRAERTRLPHDLDTDLSETAPRCQAHPIGAACSRQTAELRVRMTVLGHFSRTKVYRRMAGSYLGHRINPLVRSARVFHARHSNLQEDAIIARLLAREEIVPFCVDIAASDGVTMSNTLGLFKKGWSGLSAEMDGAKFRSLASLHSAIQESLLFRGRIRPETIRDLLRAAETPRAFGFLSLDIDGYDYFVLEALLYEYRPTLICCEINETIPPPLRFTVDYDPTFSFSGRGHFFGQSICQLELLCERFHYVFVELDYNNAFLVPAEMAVESVSAAEAYAVGYVNRPDRTSRMPWNEDMEPLLRMDIDEALAFVRSLFAAHEGRYTLTT